MTKFVEVLALLDAANEEADAASKAWNAAFPRDPAWPMGLAPDEVRFSPAYAQARNRYQNAANKVRHIMTFINKHYKKEYNATVRQRIAAKRAAKLDA